MASSNQSTKYPTTTTVTVPPEEREENPVCEVCEDWRLPKVGTITVCGRDMEVCENCDKGGDGYNGFLDEYDFCAETSSYEEKAVVETVISDDDIDLFDGDKLDDALENDNADWSFHKPTHTKDFMTIYIFPKEEEHEEK